MPVKLHRCPVTLAKSEGHPCWRVQKALDDAGIDYEVVKHTILRWRREDIATLTGQNRLPVIEFEDGTALREESKDLAERINSGGLRTTAG